MVRNFGDEAWENIKKEAGLEMDGHFLVRQVYEDAKTYDLVGAASKVLNLPAADILQYFGKMFFEFCQESGYDKILQVLGGTTRDFLQNLDALHDHLATIYPGMRAPSFRCTERQEDGALILHYYSERDGLEPIVIGIVKEVAHNFTNQRWTLRLSSISPRTVTMYSSPSLTETNRRMNTHPFQLATMICSLKRRKSVPQRFVEPSRFILCMTVTW